MDEKYTTMTRLENQLKDYVRGGLALVWQRQIIFIGAALLTGYFISIYIAVACYLFSLATEILDYKISKQIIEWDGQDEELANRFLNLCIVSTIFSSLAVSIFVFLVAQTEGHTIHFMPLLFLFAASLFAAMNNHQLIKVLIVRLMVYGATFIYIPAYDLWVAYSQPDYAELTLPAPLITNLWLQFLTVIFVLYFIVDCSRIFLRLYQRGQDQRAALVLERDRATQAYELQSQFVSVVSHELRTPLTSIKGGLTMIDSGALGEVPVKMKGVVNIAAKNSIRLGALINDLLDVQKFEFGKMDLKLERMDLANLVSESIQANETFDKSMNVSFEIDGIENPTFIDGDSNRLMQVMANILSNAVKFSKKDGVIKVTLEKLNSTVRVSVRDYGDGIPDDAKGKVFGQFSQVDSTKERKAGGTGLGMYITKKIMDGHKGNIDYISKLGEGTTFFIDIPVLE